jgi:pimeloyl-ACP methyl ester carboxylesterase
MEPSRPSGDLGRTVARMASYVLVPGAGGDDWYWHRLVPALRERGHDAIAVALPAADDSAGWSEYADVIVDAIGDRPEPIVVAQSLGGFSAPLACARKPVEQIVLLNAMIPTPGETGEAWWSNTGQHEAQLEYLATIGVTPEDASDDSVLYFHDVPADVVAEAERRHGRRRRRACWSAAMIGCSRRRSSGGSPGNGSASRRRRSRVVISCRSPIRRESRIG